MTGTQARPSALRSQADAFHATLLLIGAALERATATTEAIKTAIRREEEQIRARTAQAMAARTEWRQREISADLEQPVTREDSHGRSAPPALDALLAQMERTREALWDEAQAALQAGHYTMAVRLLTERQDLDRAMVLAQAHR